MFVHGLWLHADSWSAWADLFREDGYEPSELLNTPHPESGEAKQAHASA